LFQSAPGIALAIGVGFDQPGIARKALATNHALRDAKMAQHIALAETAMAILWKRSNYPASGFPAPIGTSEGQVQPGSASDPKDQRSDPALRP
jgi:hypothetical protein